MRLSVLWFVAVAALVTEIRSEERILQDSIWINSRPIDTLIGSEDALYCKIEDPSGVTVFEGFGQCRIVLDRVTAEHEGRWKASVGYSGRLLTTDYQFNVRVSDPEAKPSVITRVQKQRPSVMVSCSVATQETVMSCKFRTPSGRILLASQGVNEDRYNFYGSGNSGQGHECGIEITDPLTSDLGLWRCAIETTDNTYFGFLTVLCPWAMQDPNVAASVVSEPTLVAQRSNVEGVSGESLSMSCSINSALRYCYFRSRNGTTYSVRPGHPSGALEYIGAGLDAGECGIRIPLAHRNDSGEWSCHVGLTDASLPEQRVQVLVSVQDTISAYQETDHNSVSVVGNVYNNKAVEYCRFVRIDGLGFSLENMPSNYRDISSPSRGSCGIRIISPSIIENHPWTIVAKVRGRDDEISAVTTHTLNVPVVPGPEEEEATNSNNPGTVLLWVVIAMLSAVLLMLGIVMSRKSNRQWVTSMRSSFRNSFLKKQPVADNNTAVAA